MELSLGFPQLSVIPAPRRLEITLVILWATRRRGRAKFSVSQFAARDKLALRVSSRRRYKSTFNSRAGASYLANLELIPQKRRDWNNPGIESGISYLRENPELPNVGTFTNLSGIGLSPLPSCRLYRLPNAPFNPLVQIALNPSIPRRRVPRKASSLLPLLPILNCLNA